MIYLALDTCVWLELLKVRLTTEYNVFDELMFWIDNKAIQIITTENLIREWDRNKVKSAPTILQEQKNLLNSVRIHDAAATLLDTDFLKSLLDNRIQKVDAVLRTQSSVATESTDLIAEAWGRNCQEMAPNHFKDSFRDTVNILCLTHYLTQKKPGTCLFTTINYKDFSAPGDRYKVHPHLEQKFMDADLEYVFFESDLSKNKLFNHYFKDLPNYQHYLTEKRKREVQEVQLEATRPPLLDIPDDEYLDSLHYIDEILGKKRPTKPDLRFMEMLIKSHDSYKQYFLQKVGDHGLV